MWHALFTAQMAFGPRAGEVFVIAVPVGGPLHVLLVAAVRISLGAALVARGACLRLTYAVLLVITADPVCVALVGLGVLLTWWWGI